jgi:hypothetical protein
LLPFTIKGRVWLNTPACGALMTSSAWPMALRRTVPVHATLVGSVAGQPAPFVMVPPQLPNSASAAAWLMVTVWPAMVTVPVRTSPVFSAIVSPTVAVPLPVDPELITTNDAFEAAVQAHPLLTLTPTEAVAPVAATVNVFVDSVNVHVGDGCVGDGVLSESEQEASNGNKAMNANDERARMDRA